VIDAATVRIEVAVVEVCLVHVHGEQFDEEPLIGG